MDNVTTCMGSWKPVSCTCIPLSNNKSSCLVRTVIFKVLKYHIFYGCAKIKLMICFALRDMATKDAWFVKIFMQHDQTKKTLLLENMVPCGNYV